MLIGLCGGICSGKNAVAEYLTQHQNFRRLEVKSGPPSQAVDDPRLQAFGLTDDALDQDTPLQFETTGSLLEFATKRWQEHWVTTHIWDTSTLDPFMQRPFFLLVSVDAPVSLRWKRFADRCRRRQLEPPHLEEFVLWNDKQLYKKSVGHALITDRAQVRLFNSSPSLDELHAALKELNLADEQRLRPNWDQYFMELASLAAQRSNCMKRRVGCVLVRERRVISTGYNGTPRHLKNCNEGGCPRCNRGEGGGVGLSTCLCLHAEENALLEAGRDRIREGAILYCDTCPCLTCTVKIAQVGISEVVYSQGYNMDRNVCRPYPASEFDLTRTRAPKFLTQLEYACDNFLLLEMVLSTLKGQTKDEQLQSLLPSHTPNAWTQGNPTAFGCCKSKIHELFSLLWTDSLTSVEGCMFQPK